MHILFDLRTIRDLSPPTGAYLRALVGGLQSFPPEERLRFTLLLPAEDSTEITDHPCVTVVHAHYPADTAEGRRAVRNLVLRSRVDLYWGADPFLHPPRRPFGKRLTVVRAVEDLTAVGHGGFLKRFFGLRRFKARCQAADWIVCPCHTLAVRLIAMVGLPKRRRVRVIRNGVPPAFRRHTPEEIRAVLRQFRLPLKYTVIIAREAPDSNLETPLRALAASSEVPAMPCVIVGVSAPSPTLRELIRACHLEGLVRFLPDALSDATLSALLSGAQVLFEPALREGYLPSVLFGMASGTPVICAATESSAELFGAAAVRVHPTDVNEWCNAFTALMVSTVMRDRLIARGTACAEENTWQAAIRATIAFIKEILPR